MKRYTVAQVRDRLASALDEAARGIPVFIERRGIRYRLTAERSVTKARARRSRIETVDEAIERGEWEWRWTARGVSFKRRPR